MKSGANRENIKNLIFLIVSAALLVGATVAWFTTVKSAEIKDFMTYVGDESSNDVFYEAIDENHNNIIDGTEKYVEINPNEDGTTEIRTFDMMPGQKYFYKIEAGPIRQGATAALVFGNVNLGTTALQNYLYVEASLVNRATGSVVANLTEQTLRSMTKNVDGEQVATAFTKTNLSAGTYDVYYNFYIFNAPNDQSSFIKPEHNITIGRVNLITSVA